MRTRVSLRTRQGRAGAVATVRYSSRSSAMRLEQEWPGIAAIHHPPCHVSQNRRDWHDDSHLSPRSPDRCARPCEVAVRVLFERATDFDGACAGASGLV